MRQLVERPRVRRTGVELRQRTAHDGVAQAGEPARPLRRHPLDVPAYDFDEHQLGALDSATKTHPYDDALARMRVALRAGRVRAILWHQGESDATPALSVLYAAKLRALIARFRTDLGQPNLPFVIGQLGRFEGKPWTAEVQRVDSVHRAIAASVPNVAYVSSEGLRDKGDKLHFDAASARAFGERYAAAYLALVKR